MFGGCLFAVSTVPATFAQWCGGEQVQSTPLSGAGAELRLRLVNGWIWVNDIDSGAAWVTSPQKRLDRVDDWGAILSNSTDDSDENNTEEEGGEVLEEIDPDDPNAEIVESDDIDEEGPNRPPVARDDETQTRVDRPIDVDVLANDTDPNGDVLLVQRGRPDRRRGGDDDQPRWAWRAGRAGRRLRRRRHVRLHDHRRTGRERLRRRHRRGHRVDRCGQPPP